MLQGSWARRAYFEDVSDMSDHFDMSRWSGVSLTCLQQVVRVGLVEFGERHDKRTKIGNTTAQQTADRLIR